MSTIKLTDEQQREIFKPAKEQGDKLVIAAFVALFGIGIILSFWYDTYFIALTVGGLNLATYLVSRAVFRKSNFYQYIAGIIFPIFMAQFIYQMHGMFEMHFFAFLGSVVMIGYQNWKLQIPLLLTIVVHHSTFAYLQYGGMQEIYFTQLDYMDLETFIFHAAIAAIIVFICGFWGYDIAQKTIKAGLSNIQLENQLAIVEANKVFAEEIAKGNLNVEFENQEALNDELGQALIRMQASLKEASENEKKERFVTNGINKISEMFQTYSDNPDKFYVKCINFLTGYLDVVLGSIFVVNNDDKNPLLELKGTYAYDRNKYVEGLVAPGAGLVGQCYLEKKSIYMTDVPQGYLNISSGLGDTEPGCIIIFPLISNDTVLGVIELAGFHPLTDEKQVFIERVGENLAASINTLRTAQSTKLLLETSQSQQQMMQEQEEEMRQNIEEMQATQEQTELKISGYEQRIKELEGQL